MTLRSNDGAISKVTVSLRYIPVKMKLDPSESINNMGTLRVNVMDAADLPSADRNGFSDPYCKFRLDGKEVYKTKVQKKTLHPAWNEFFETPIKSRIGADFKVDVYDWDFGDKADHLGSATINLESLEPYKSSDVELDLDGKSGAIHLKLLFKSDYVMRARQGSTLSGTFAAPGKIVGAPVKGVGLVGGGVIKGASFLKQNFTTRFRGGSKDESDNASVTNVEPPSTLAVPAADGSPATPQRASAITDGASPNPSTSPLTPQSSHGRSRSAASAHGGAAGGGKGDTGAATFTIVSATGYPPSTNVRVVVKQVTAKGAKEVHKTKVIKAHGSSDASANGTGGTLVQFDSSHESFKVSSVSADAQFQIQVKNHSTFGSDDVLGEAPLFVDDQGSSAGKERNVKVGNGYVTVKTGFISSEESSPRPGTSHSNSGDKVDEKLLDSPDSKRAPRRSFLSKRVPSGTPNGN